MRDTWYVYLLCDPDTEMPFYVGKGSGNRIDKHQLLYAIDGNVAKKEMIRQIQKRGKQILKKKIAEFSNEQDAFIYEWSMINLYHESLTNIRSTPIKIQPLPKKPTRTKEYFTIEEACGYIGVKYQSLNRMIKDLNIEKRRFSHIRHPYIAMADVKKMKAYKDEPWTVV